MMDSLQFLAPWVSTVTPVLPAAVLVRWAQPIFWGLVLAFLVAQVFARRPAGVRRMAMVAAFVWACIPGAWSPTWWMGLAFQLPSWTTVLLCSASLLTLWRHPRPSESIRRGTGFLGWLAIVFGLLLLLDMFILLPFALYRWGFSALALVCVLATATAVWAVAGSALQKSEAALALLATALFVLTRLPTGNVFDALLDPWLWLVLVWSAVRQAVSAVKSRFSGDDPLALEKPTQ